MNARYKYKKTFCIALLITLAVVAIAIFKIPAGTVFFAGMLLACPLLHMWMMRGGGHKH